MMGPKKLSEIYDELRTAINQEAENPILALDREIRTMKRNRKVARKELKSLILVRQALDRAVTGKPVKRRRPLPTKGTRKAV